MSEEEKDNDYKETEPEEKEGTNEIEEKEEESNEEEKETDREQMSVEEDSCNNSDDDRIFVTNDEMMNLQLFRNICFNIRENLDSIKSYKKVPILYPHFIVRKSSLGNNITRKKSSVLVNSRCSN